MYMHQEISEMNRLSWFNYIMTYLCQRYKTNLKVSRLSRASLVHCLSSNILYYYNTCEPKNVGMTGLYWPFRCLLSTLGSSLVWCLPHHWTLSKKYQRWTSYTGLSDVCWVHFMSYHCTRKATGSNGPQNTLVYRINEQW